VTIGDSELCRMVYCMSGIRYSEGVKMFHGVVGNLIEAGAMTTRGRSRSEQSRPCIATSP
jgi:hypothetical protein